MSNAEVETRALLKFVKPLFTSRVVRVAFLKSESIFGLYQKVLAINLRCLRLSYISPLTSYRFRSKGLHEFKMDEL